MSTYHLMDEVKRISDEIEARTGYKPYHFTSAPTPTSVRIVFGNEVFLKETEAYARVLQIRDQIASGEWDAWNCRACPWRFDTEAERDNHEEHEPACRTKLARRRAELTEEERSIVAEATAEDSPLMARVRQLLGKALADEEQGSSGSEPRRAFFVDESMRDEHGYIPGLVVEDEPGYHSMRGNPEEFQQPWYWGKDLATARRICAQANAKMGISETDARAILASSHAASFRQDAANYRQGN